ncbi:MAG: YgcG family protein, partial [Burkholderiaceae bacterium]
MIAMLLRRVPLLCLLMLFLLPAPMALAKQAPLPQISGWVTDTTGTLDSNTKEHLNDVLADLEKRKGSQVAVLLVPSTGEDTIESYARRVFDQWRIGRAKVDDGILFLVAKDDRRLRIEVGYGLEGAVPDLLAGRIIREQVTPRFKQGDYAGGVVAGVDSLVALVDGEALPPPPAGLDQSASSGSDDDSPVVMLLPLAIMSFFMPSAFAAFAVGFFVFLMFNSLLIGVLAGFVGFILSRIGRRFGAGGRSSSARASRRGGAVGG